ncbi:glycoside hydrolase family 28 protein [Catenovulum sp. 2E275]|uniref:glycoside hydrolase family 28 protein n=1 Tax=Catenovulum sp. 2E275 TaxID=2980497 RepID=UPI0021CFAFBA|nr:glycoside hydrolase family 28 protein [Catenovulum sp. 2E275]MCU4676542.1 glycoside hydrolase family 28 protein [Catenovulum sp. 2E275]
MKRSSLELSRRHFLQASVSLALVSGCSSTFSSAKQPVMIDTITVSAPFSMPPIKIPNFTAAPVFNIKEFGAKPESKESNDRAIAAAISTAHSNGGGIVFIPEGSWQVGPIHFKSFVNLHIAEGAILHFSGDPKDYLPAVKTTWEGMECYNYSPLIYAYECVEIAITGKGLLTTQMDIWTIWGKRPKPHMEALASLYHQAAKGIPVEDRVMTYEGANLRPHFIQFNRCQNVLIEDINIENSPFWVLHPFLCRDVVIRRVNVKAHGHNNDGIDPEMTQNMLIEDSIFDQGDDALAVKSGRNQDAWRINVPTKNLVMRNCRIKQGHQLLAVGSELSGGVENVLVENCQFDDGTQYSGTGNLMFIKTNERRGGYVKNIYMRNVKAHNIGGAPLAVETDVLYQWRNLVPTYEKRLTPIEGLYLENIEVKTAKHLCKIEAQDEMPVKNVELKNVKVEQLLGENVIEKNVQNLVVS